MTNTDAQAVTVQQVAQEMAERANDSDDLFGGVFAQEYAAFLAQRARDLRDNPESLPAHCK